MAAKRKYFITHGSVPIEMFPVSVGTQKYSWQREPDQIFKRKKLSSKLRFKKESGDFNYFVGIEAVDSCDEIKIEVKVLCSGQYVTEWKGFFSTGGGTFDFDKCYFEVLPEPDDAYRCILSNWEKEFNIFDYQVDVATLSQNITYQTLIANTYTQPTNCDGYIECSLAAGAFGFYAPGYTSSADMLSKGWCIKSHTVTNQGAYLRLEIEILVGADPFWADYNIGDTVTSLTSPYPHGEICKVEIIDPGGVNGAGGVYLLTLKNVTGTFATLMNINRNGLYGGAGMARITDIDSVDYCQVVTEYESQLIDIACVGVDCPATPAGAYFIQSNCGTTGYCTFRRCPEVILDQEFRGVFFNTLLEEIAGSICANPVTSIFYDLNPDVTDPLYSVGTNYMTGLNNRVAHLLISQMSDVIDPNATNPATIGKVTLKQLLQWARAMKVYWDIVDVSGTPTLRLEHYEYYKSIQAIDLTEQQYLQYVAGFNRYEHLKDRIPRSETFKWAVAGGADFFGKPIIYSDTCSTEGLTVDYMPENLSTDIGYIFGNTSLSLDGFVMIATDFVAGQYVINSESGNLTGNVFANAHLSWANLHSNYHRWDRYLPFGNMNDNANTPFLSWKPNVKQPTIKVAGCCLSVDAEGYAVTDLGDTILNKFAFIEKMELDFTTDLLSFDLTYSI